MARTAAARIDDMLQAAATILTIAEQPPVPPDIHRLAMERAFEIISEASRHIPDHLKASEPDIDWKSIAGIGNVIRHDYAMVDIDVLRMTAKHDIPNLHAALLRMLERIDG